MRQVQLGADGPMVSQWALGTMTFANQTPQDEAHAQISRARAFGIDFLDTAEVYPVAPVRPETVGHTEAVIGAWIAKNGQQGWKIATKVSGKGSAARGGVAVNAAEIRRAVEGSLTRLQTDHIDLYQIHAPNRGHYGFRRSWSYDPSGQDRAETLAHMDDVLGEMGKLRQEGKIGQFGLSNETAWGMACWIDRAEALGGPRPVSVQNEYSLLCRLYDTDMAEMSVNEDVTLLAYSTLGAGFLTGKYQAGTVPEGSRMAAEAQMGGRNTDRVRPAVALYQALADKYGIDPVHMALAWIGTRPFKTIPLIGATRLAHLEHELAGYGTVISPELKAEIDAVHKLWPLPF